MAFYEHVFIARQDVSQQQVETLTQQFTELVEGLGGKVTKTEYWGIKPLTFRIKKNRKGHYTLLNLDAPHQAVTELERVQGINEDILRTLTVKVEELDPEQSAMLNQRGRDRERGDRDGRDRGDRDRGDRGDRGGGPRRGGFGGGGGGFGGREGGGGGFGGRDRDGGGGFGGREGGGGGFGGRDRDGGGGGGNFERRGSDFGSDGDDA